MRSVGKDLGHHYSSENVKCTFVWGGRSDEEVQVTQNLGPFLAEHFDYSDFKKFDVTKVIPKMHSIPIGEQ